MKLLLSTLLLSLSLPAFADYIFMMRDERLPTRPFTVVLPDSNPSGISSLEAYFKDGDVVVDENGDPAIGIMNGELLRSPRTRFHDWDFTLEGRTLEFSDLSAEVCDGRFSDVEDAPDYWFGTVRNFCPWSTRRWIRKIWKNGKLIFSR